MNLRVEEFEQYARQFNPNLTVTVTNPGRGGEEHWRITGGSAVVSWWPFSYKQTVYCELTGRRQRFSKIDDVIRLTNSQPKPKKHKNKIRQERLSKVKKHDLPCPDCGKVMNLRSDSRFKKHGIWYACQDFPRCKGSHGAHPDGSPLGKPAGRETKQWRIRAHDLLDALWRGKKATMKRSSAYRKLAEHLGIPFEECHIGSFDIEQCQKTVDFLTDEKKAKKS